MRTSRFPSSSGGGLPTPSADPLFLDTDPPVGKPPFPSLGADPPDAEARPLDADPLWLYDL